VFADEYPRFIEVSGLKKTKPERMNHRYEALFAANRDIFEGARVLDLASHDGRWSFAALKAGAAHVTGVEVREEFVNKGRETFEFYGQDPSTYDFICGDVFEVLAREKFDVDVVLLLGYLYHTYRHTELMYRIHELAPKHMILDTRVVPGREPTLNLFLESTPDAALNAARDPYSLDRVLVAHHTMPALLMLLTAYDFEVESVYDWAARLANLPRENRLTDYARGNRVTLRCRPRQSAITPGSEAAVFLQTTPRGPKTPRRRPPAPRRPQRSRSAPRPPQRVPGWRDLINMALAKATGHELRKTSRTR
jgi:hypothetical protein